MLRNLLFKSRALPIYRQPAMFAPQNRSFSKFVNHRDEADNLEESPFEFTEENYKLVKSSMSNFPDNYKHSAVIPVLFIAQK